MNQFIVHLLFAAMGFLYGYLYGYAKAMRYCTRRLKEMAP